jgi:cytochrome c556
LNTPRPNAPNKPIAKWQQFNKQQQQAAQDLLDAVKANKPKDVQAAATKLYASCTACHGVFR